MHIERALIAATKKWDEISECAIPGEKIPPIKQWLQYQKIKRAMKKCFENNKPLSFKSLSESKETHRLAEIFLQMQVPDDLHADYVIVTENFIKRAQTQCPHLSDEDVFQALRNVWIMVLIQVLSENPVRLTNAMFAYSMLYPLTDNVTDDPTLSEPFKHHFIKRFGRRLQGELLSAENAYETHVFDMIEWIEKDYPRHVHPKVYDSLMAIFEAQKKSLSQQYQALSIDVIKKITFEKGATSVVADGFLVLGDLEEAMFIFLTDYGIALQLSDDLQDMACDAEQRHQTLA